MLAIFGSVLADRVPPHRLEALAPCRRTVPLEAAAAVPNGKRLPRLRLLD